jgi:SNF2 family DNA or RNA helicase
MFLNEKHNVVVYPNVNSAQLKASIVSTIPLDDRNAAIPYTIQDMQLARLMGLPALSPIERDYDWPSAFPSGPRAHQRVMASFMTLHPRCNNLSAMRTGKTMACVWAADYLMQEGLVDRALVICTLSNMERVWDKEIYRHMLARRRGVILHGSKEQRLAALNQDADFYIINHDGIKVGSKKGLRGFEPGELAKIIAERTDIDLVIVDEATAFKLSSTARFKSLRFIVQNKPYVWLLTGTPTPNAPTDAWAFQKLLRPMQTESFMNFRERTMMRVSQFKWIPRKEAPELVAKFLQPAIRFSREDCIDIPPIQIEQVECELSPTQQKAYDTMKKDLALLTASGQRIDAVNEAVLRMKLIQISCGAVYGPDRDVHLTDAKPRLELLLDLLEEADSKILVFAPLTSVVNLLYREIKKAGYSAELITGAVSAKARSKIFQAFTETPDPHVIVADPGTVAHGLDLCAASTVIWFGPTDKLETYQQANARIDGTNQRRKMVAFQIASTAVEKEIYRRLDEKRTLQGLILDMVKK